MNPSKEQTQSCGINDEMQPTHRDLLVKSVHARSPVCVFTIGSLALLILTALYYFLVPRFNYFEGGYTIYQPGRSLQDSAPEEYALSNVYLIFKYGQYLFMYLAAFVLVYFVCSKVGRLKISTKFVWTHLVLTSVAFILLIFLNPYIVVPQNMQRYVSDIYISGEFSKDDVLQGTELILWYSSLQTPTSVIGIVLCVIGVVAFAVGTLGRIDTLA